jgi:hypothetical protein
MTYILFFFVRPTHSANSNVFGTVRHGVMLSMESSDKDSIVSDKREYIKSLEETKLADMEDKLKIEILQSKYGKTLHKM